MNHPYYGGSHSPLARRATIPISSTLAPSVSMIDPALETSNFQYPSTPIAQNNGHLLPNQLHMNMANEFPPSPQHQRQQAQQATQEVPRAPLGSPKRSLPSKEVNEDNLDEAYAKFILYCNPSIPLAVETEELKKGFRNPPRSDGNIFSTWTLFVLLQKLEKKEIKTWAHLVIELGVEPPDREKNQSTQKVQQYAVRLKRWLHAYHVDAFCNYLSSKPSTYYTERPQTDAELAETVREGVPPEEDLAVRALLPEWRPKRGRRKADDVAEGEQGIDGTNSINQHHSIRASSAEISTMFEDHYSAAPSSAAPWSASPHVPQGDVWQAAHVAIAPKAHSPAQQHQTLSAHPNSATQRMWQFPRTGGNTAETPASPYPQSAITPRAPYSAAPAFGENEPKSALPGSGTGSARSPNTKVRKRHASAISSAWNQGSTSGGKIRGRPPSNRNVQDGPFGTFPVNPNAKDSNTSPNTLPTPISTTTSQPPQHSSLSPPQQHSAQMSRPIPASSQHRHTPTPPGDSHVGGRKPSKLQLQVPHQPGNPVRLATPPRVLVNGESQLQAPVHQRQPSADFFETLGDVSEEELSNIDPNEEDEGNVDWRRRCGILVRKLQEKEEQLKKVRRAVLDAVM
ncbi:uncharacterized protein KY384_000217 [Bacidia gigantensis]|uniref:uncharacterized protein n=1 Tax=Bacidia gigantensis TaxID=2732470 RepID=UPI001D038E65|nr:uncharacterized protein KY384_000217 [Bacidia gigantensis]KAG8526224.1 hypothetical protein KY384_000217 [Bacidia gigantensis]